MKRRTILFFALLNALALAAGFYVLNNSAAVRKDHPRALPAPQAPQPRRAPPPVPAAPVVIYKTNQFKWAQLESADYRQYIANLRAVGCPESTIRDLIMTDVMRLYAARRGQFYHNGREFKYWETDEKRKLKPTQLEERERQLAQIDKELPSVLRELLGINYEKELNKYFVDSNEEQRRLAFLDEDKRARVMDLSQQFDSRRDYLLELARDGQLSVTQLAQLNKIETERQAALAALLTPEEYAQYELSTSETADRLRKELVGFNPTEKEFREIYYKQKALDARYAGQDMTDEAVMAAKTADQKSLDQELRPLLGEERAAELDRCRSEEYRNFYSFAEQYELTPTTSQALLEMREIAEDQREKLLANKSLPPERRAEALQAIQSETERMIRQTMGEKTYAAYSQDAGKWIQKLGSQ